MVGTGTGTGTLNYGVRRFTTVTGTGTGTFIESLPYTISSPGVYYLASDLSCDNSGIWIKSNDVTLDLNGHTLTYGVNGAYANDIYTPNGRHDGNVGHCGIFAGDRPDETEDFDNQWTDDDYTGVVIRNGRIVCGSNQTGTGTGTGTGTDSSIRHSPAMILSTLIGAVIRDVECDIWVNNSEVVRIGPSADIQYCTLHNRGVGDAAYDRHNQLGVIQAYGSSANQVVKWNYIPDGMNVGIRTGDDSTIHGNYISIDTDVTNSYAISAGEGTTVTDNVIDNPRGQGITGDMAGMAISGNVVRNTLLPNSEYNNFAIHGIKLEWEATGNPAPLITDNDVRVTSNDGCWPSALSLSRQDPDGCTITGNTFEAVHDETKEGQKWSIACGFNSVDTTGDVVIQNNTFISNHYLAGPITNYTNNGTVRECTFIGKHDLTGTEVPKFFYGNSGSTGNIDFVDCTFIDVDRRSHDFPTPGVEWDDIHSYTIKWTLTLTGTPGATGTIVDSQDTETEYTIGEDGTWSGELPEYRAHWDGTTDTETETEYNPYTIYMDGVTGTGTSQSVTLDQATELEVGGGANTGTATATSTATATATATATSTAGDEMPETGTGTATGTTNPATDNLTDLNTLVASLGSNLLEYLDAVGITEKTSAYSDVSRLASACGGDYSTLLGLLNRLANAGNDVQGQLSHESTDTRTTACTQLESLITDFNAMEVAAGYGARDYSAITTLFRDLVANSNDLGTWLQRMTSTELSNAQAATVILASRANLLYG